MNTERTEKFVNAIACDLEEGGFRQVSGTTLRRTLATAVSAALPLLEAGNPVSSPAGQGDDLLPCPFCGNNAEFVPYKNNGLTVKCKSMGCIQRHQRTLRYGIEWLRASMTEHWNARALAARPPGAQEPRADLVPGIVRCAKCAFQLARTTLYMGSGTVGAGDSKTEPCPNGCGPLWPVTWETWAREGWAEAERLHMENAAAPPAQGIDLGVLQAVSSEYNEWIIFHAAGNGDFDDFLRQRRHRDAAPGVGNG